jgi:hypothetical protein
MTRYGSRFSGRMTMRKRADEDAMTKIEVSWLLHLKAEWGERAAIFYEEVKFRIATNEWYTPDFVVFGEDGMSVYEVKGPFATEESRAKWKAAAERYAWMDWYWVTRDSKTGSWKVEHYTGRIRDGRE